MQQEHKKPRRMSHSHPTTINLLLSLPSQIRSHISTFCATNDVIALASTCRTLHQDVLPIHCRRYDLPREWKIPIFFSHQCHSVTVTWELSLPGSHQYHCIGLYSRPRQQSDDNNNNNNNKAPKTRVESSCQHSQHGENLRFRIVFRNDPSLEYFLCHRNLFRDDDHTVGVGTLHQQWMLSGWSSALLSNAFHAGLEMGCIPGHVWELSRSFLSKRQEALPFLMQLFVSSWECISRVPSPSPLHTFFDTLKEDSIHVPEQIANILEQVLEQKEPTHCVTLPFALEQVLDRSTRPSSPRHAAQHLQDCKLPRLLLTKEFVWNRPLDPDGDTAVEYGSSLEFVARIPLVAKTTGVSLRVSNRTLGGTHMFVLFFQKRRSSVPNLENPILGHVFIRQHWNYRKDIHFDVVDPTYEACFLYYVPGPTTTTMKLQILEVQLETAANHDHHQALRKGMERLLVDAGFDNELPLDQRLLPVTLFRNVAWTLLGPDKQQYTILKDVLDRKPVDTTPDGLRCIVDVCNVMLQE